MLTYLIYLLVVKYCEAFFFADAITKNENILLGLSPPKWKITITSKAKKKYWNLYSLQEMTNRVLHEFCVNKNWHVQFEIKTLTKYVKLSARHLLFKQQSSKFWVLIYKKKWTLNMTLLSKTNPLTLYIHLQKLAFIVWYILDTIRIVSIDNTAKKMPSWHQFIIKKMLV